MREKEVIAGNESGCFQKYNGQAEEVQLLSGEEKPLVTIGAKAFLSCKHVERLFLPETVENVEDWAFAHMKNLSEIILPAKEICFGKKVFLGCDKLCRVLFLEKQDASLKKQNVHAETVVYEGISYFLASMFRFFPGSSLENLKMAGDEQGQWQWLAEYDEALQSYIGRADDYDFEPAFIGWFDIEDVDDQKQRYVIQQKKHKIRLAFQRLLYGEKLSGQTEQYLKAYLRKESTLVEALLPDCEEPCSRDIRYFRIWEQAGGLDMACTDRFLERIPESEPEIRGYLLQIRLGSMDKNNFFENLDL